jgi:xanthine dehydrogenase accessory factor
VTATLPSSPVLAALLQSLDQREPVALVTVVTGEGAMADLVGAHLAVWLDPERTVLGNARLGELHDAAVAGAREALAARTHRTLQLAGMSGALTLFVEVQVQPPHLIVVGAGHIAVPLAAVARICDFEVSVLDDRPLYANSQRFPTATRVIAAPFAEGLRSLRRGRVAFDPYTYVVLVTRGHQHDVECLLEILDDPVAYIGMIGSQRRIRAVFDLLTDEQGIPAAKFDRIYAPVGLAIGAQTPAEIAVCIMGEIINVTRGGQGVSLSAQLRAERQARRTRITREE